MDKDADYLRIANDTRLIFLRHSLKYFYDRIEFNEHTIRLLEEKLFLLEKARKNGQLVDVKKSEVIQDEIDQLEKTLDLVDEQPTTPEEKLVKKEQITKQIKEKEEEQKKTFTELIPDVTTQPIILPNSSPLKISVSPKTNKKPNSPVNKTKNDQGKDQIDPKRLEITKNLRKIIPKLDNPRKDLNSTQSVGAKVASNCAIGQTQTSVLNALKLSLNKETQKIGVFLVNNCAGKVKAKSPNFDELINGLDPRAPILIIHTGENTDNCEDDKIDEETNALRICLNKEPKITIKTSIKKMNIDRHSKLAKLLEVNYDYQEYLKAVGLQSEKQPITPDPTVKEITTTDISVEKEEITQPNPVEPELYLSPDQAVVTVDETPANPIIENIFAEKKETDNLIELETNVFQNNLISGEELPDPFVEEIQSIKENEKVEPVDKVEIEKKEDNVATGNSSSGQTTNSDPQKVDKTVSDSDKEYIEIILQRRKNDIGTFGLKQINDGSPTPAYISVSALKETDVETLKKKIETNLGIIHDENCKTFAVIVNQKNATEDRKLIKKVFMDKKINRDAVVLLIKLDDSVSGDRFELGVIQVYLATDDLDKPNNKLVKMKESKYNWGIYQNPQNFKVAEEQNPTQLPKTNPNLGYNLWEKQIQKAIRAKTKPEDPICAYIDVPKRIDNEEAEELRQYIEKSLDVKHDKKCKTFGVVVNKNDNVTNQLAELSMKMNFNLMFLVVFLDKQDHFKDVDGQAYYDIDGNIRISMTIEELKQEKNKLTILKEANYEIDKYRELIQKKVPSKNTNIPVKSNNPEDVVVQ